MFFLRTALSAADQCLNTASRWHYEAESVLLTSFKQPWLNG